MISSSWFREGMKAAIPVWIAFGTVSFTLGIAAKTHGLHLAEILLMSALVFAAPAQFAAFEPLVTGRPALQILLTTFLINLRFLVMSAAISRYFRSVRRGTLLFASHFISISTFVLPYIHFQKQPALPVGSAEAGERGRENLSYFLGLSLTSFVVWLLGSAIGYWAALRVPAGAEEGLKFLLPGFFACLLATEIKGKTALWIAAASFFAVVPGALLNREWGWLGSALLIATVGWGIEQWKLRALRS